MQLVFKVQGVSGMIQGGGWGMQRRQPRLVLNLLDTESRRPKRGLKSMGTEGDNRRRLEDPQGNQRSLET